MPSRTHATTSALAVGLLLGLAVSAAGCGGTEQSPAPAQPSSEPLAGADLGPALPDGWRRELDLRRGIAIGVPPGWEACATAQTSALISPERLVVVSLAADRSTSGAAIAVDEYAARAGAALPGYERALEPSEPRPFESGLEAYFVRAEGTGATTGVDQDIELVVLRDEGGSTAIAQIAATSIAAAREPARRARRAVATLRLFAPAPTPEQRVDPDEACPPPVRDPRD